MLTAFISPFYHDRKKAHELLGNDFIEIYCQCDIEICEQRDVKGLYKKARNGEIQHFTGISSPYEVPENAELVVDTGTLSIEDAVQQVMQYLEQNIFHLPETVSRTDSRSSTLEKTTV